MQKNVSYLNWRNYFNPQEIYSVDEKVILLDNQLMESPHYPFKVDMLTATICVRGRAEGSVNLQKIEMTPNSFHVILPGQIVTHDYQSEDFEAKYIIMSNTFLESLGLEDKFPLFGAKHQNIKAELSDYELEAVLIFYKTLKWNIMHRNEHVLETLKHLTLAFFYGFSHSFQKIEPQKLSNRAEELTEKFIDLVKQHYKEEHSLDFYANRLCVTSKHLTTMVKNTTEKSAKEWINRYLILEAQALLKSTNLTIQQIADRLNFASQDVFSKYFRHYTELSPKEYRLR